MTNLQPLLDRSRYTDEEWNHAQRGLCGQTVEYGMHMGRVVLCEKPSSPTSFYRYCDDHDDEARESRGYGR